jgi:hypothetical protein
MGAGLPTGKMHDDEVDVDVALAGPAGRGAVS